jgi:CSLREA domain-containing protein
MCRILFLACALVFPFIAQGATFTVNSTGDGADASPGNGACATSGGVCTLRAAIQEANALAGTDTINFGIASGPQTISPASDLPAITTALTIDGTTQPGVGSAPRILIDGANARTVGLDLTPTITSVTIRGLAIGRFVTAGIRTLQASDTVVVESSYIGVGLDGVTDLGNGDGIFARISDLGGSALILGNASGGGNVISGNQDMGLELTDNGGAGAKLTTLTLQGNIIGLGADGSTAVPNLSGGIRTNLQFGTITIGGSVAARNILSGNGGSGYITAGFLQADAITFSDNYVGVAQDGITARGNNGDGAILVGKQYTVDSNIVAANTGNGLSFATCNLPSPIRGNRIGVALDGSARGNGGAGIRWTFQNGGIIGGPGTDQNLIAFNGGAGVRVIDGLAEIDENSIFSNGKLGIDLGTANVVDVNDNCDGDTGSGNNLQNHPTILSAQRAGGITFVSGSLNSTASSTFQIRFYSSMAADPSGFGEGETFLGEAMATTNGACTASFNFSTPGAPVGSFITATATAASGDTSEFSNALAVGAAGEVHFSSASYGTPESGSVTLTLQRVNGSSGAVSVDWTTEFGSATAEDFTASSGTANFADGQTTQTIMVPITADTRDEIDESFDVVLSHPTGGLTLGSPSIAAVVITDDDDPPSISIADASANEGNSGNTPLAFDVTLSAPSGKPISVDFVTTGGSATAGSDFAAAAGTLSFAPGETAKPITVQLVGDTVTELDETFTLTLSNASEATIDRGVATGTIVNDDGVPSITIGDVAVVEGDSGTFSAIFPLTLSGPSGAVVTVDWSTSDGTAAAGSDYEAGSAMATFAPGATTATIAVTIDGDALIENNETFFVNLANPTNANLLDAQGIGTIADDDGTPSLSVNDPAVVEGVPATFTVTLAPASALPVSVTYATSDLTAKAWSDYTGATNTLSFAPGETSKTIDVATLEDNLAEPSEQFRMTLSAPSGATIGDAIGTATIADADGPPHVTIGNASVTEANAGTTSLTFTIELSHASVNSIDVTWSTADGTATAGSDYTPGAGHVVFAPGDVAKTISIAVTPDTLFEPDETFFINLTSATNAAIGDGQATGTILNDDAPSPTPSMTPMPTSTPPTTPTPPVAVATLPGRAPLSLLAALALLGGARLARRGLAR